MIAEKVRPVRRHSVISRTWGWIIRHEALPAPYAPGPSGRAAFDVTFLLGLTYAVVLTLFTFGRQDTFTSHAEDLGIMDQTLWNTIHGHFMTQTICNPVTDVNCLGSVSRFAIHFEPILILLSAIYLVWPSVKALLLIQAVVVASGTIPIWLLATRWLRNPWWGVAFAAMFLAYPPMLAAVTDDFHPETLAATILLWAFYFLFIRRYRALVISLILALLCKETLTLDVISIGVFVALFHRRWRLGVGIILGGALTLALALVLMRLLSPVGHSPVSERFNGLLHAPLSTLLAMSHDPGRRSYLLKLLAPTGFLPLLSPWVAVIALPSSLINLLSANASMYTGGYQYNTDIAAVLVVASIDAMGWIAPLVTGWFDAARARLKYAGAPRWLMGMARPQLALVVVLLPALIAGLESQASRLYQQVTVRHIWPVVTAHDRLGDEIAASIPVNASVSAQSTLTPHVSHRLDVYQFPSGAENADYVFLDVTAGDYYPFTSPANYVRVVTSTLDSDDFQVATARDGYLLLRRDPGHGPLHIPASFYSFAYVSSLAGVHQVDVRFAGGLELVGYQVNPPRVSKLQPELTVTTYWRATRPLTAPRTVVVTLTRPDGSGRFVFDDSLTQEWLPPIQWQPGQTIMTQTWPIYVYPVTLGNYTLGVEVRNGEPSQHPPVTQAVAATVLTPPGAGGLPEVNPSGTGAWLAIVPLQ